MSQKVFQDVPNQQLSLRWNNYLKRVTNAFDSLLSQGDLTDVTLCCEGKKIKAHRMLLSACSSYFKDIFKENPCRHPVIIFRNVKYEDLNAVIYFIYHGEVNVSQDQLASFLITAEMLQIQGLTDNFDDEVNENQSKRTLLEQSTDLEIVSDSKRQKIFVQDDTELDDKTNIGSVPCSSDDVDSVNNSGNFITESIRKLDTSKESYVIDYSKSDDKEVIEVSATSEEPIFGRDNSIISTDTFREGISNENSQVSGLVKFRCHVCLKGFKHPTSLTLHKDAHTGKTQCPVCRRSFSRSYDMRNHLQRIHQDQTSAAD